MRNLVGILLIYVLFSACGSDKKGSMLVKGEIKGLKKGTLYLKKLKDTAFVAIDSVELDGVSTFALTDKLESPEIYNLVLNNDREKTILFFGDKGEITINTHLEKFGFRAEIKGLQNQILLNEYSEMAQKFNNQRLQLIQAEFDFREDATKKDSILNLKNSLIRRRYLYTTNFAVTHADNVIAPYLALTELGNANIKLLDTIHASMTDEVRASKYGKLLEEFLTDIKK